MLWRVDSNGKIVPVGHDGKRQQPGDFTFDPETGNMYRCYAERGRVRWAYLYHVPQTCQQV